jgi:hypothetical protein
MAGKPIPTRLQAETEITVIALGFGHEHSEAAQIYIDADRILKQRSLDRSAHGISSGRWPDRGALLRPLTL